MSSSADEVDDFDLVTVRQSVCSIQLARDDLAVHFDGDAALVQLQLAEHIREGQAVRECLRFAVDGHAHAGKIVVRTYLYNVGVIW